MTRHIVKTLGAVHEAFDGDGDSFLVVYLCDKKEFLRSYEIDRERSGVCKECLTNAVKEDI